jgi:hypothetical protein
MPYFHVYTTENKQVARCFVVDAISEEEVEEKFLARDYVAHWILSEITSSRSIEDIVPEDTVVND